ncbi:MAG: VOC family protein, partial [Acidobacteriota bacterium]
MTALPRFLQVVETSIYVDDLRAAERFYCDVLGLRRVGGHAGRGLFFAAGRNMLLAFYAPETLRGERVPPHGARGAGHFALEVERVSDLER